MRISQRAPTIVLLLVGLLSMISSASAAEIWTTASDCNIGQSRIVRDTAVIAQCDVRILTSSEVTFLNSSLTLQTESGALSLFQEDGSAFTMTNGTINSSNGDEINVSFYGYSTLENTFIKNAVVRIGGQSAHDWKDSDISELVVSWTQAATPLQVRGLKQNSLISEGNALSSINGLSAAISSTRIGPIELRVDNRAIIQSFDIDIEKAVVTRGRFDGTNIKANRIELLGADAISSLEKFEVTSLQVVDPFDVSFTDGRAASVSYTVTSKNVNIANLDISLPITLGFTFSETSFVFDLDNVTMNDLSLHVVNTGRLSVTNSDVENITAGNGAILSLSGTSANTITVQDQATFSDSRSTIQLVNTSTTSSVSLDKSSIDDLEIHNDGTYLVESATIDQITVILDGNKKLTSGDINTDTTTDWFLRSDDSSIDLSIQNSRVKHAALSLYGTTQADVLSLRGFPDLTITVGEQAGLSLQSSQLRTLIIDATTPTTLRVENLLVNRSFTKINAITTTDNLSVNISSSQIQFPKLRGMGSTITIQTAHLDELQLSSPPAPTTIDDSTIEHILLKSAYTIGIDRSNISTLTSQTINASQLAATNVRLGTLATAEGELTVTGSIIIVEKNAKITGEGSLRREIDLLVLNANDEPVQGQEITVSSGFGSPVLLTTNANGIATLGVSFTNPLEELTASTELSTTVWKLITPTITSPLTLKSADLTPPKITIITFPEPSATSEKQMTIDVEDDVAEVIACQPRTYQNDDRRWSQPGTPKYIENGSELTFQFPISNEGNYNLSIFCEDLTGKTTQTENITITMDSTPPTITIETPKPPEYTLLSTITAQVTPTDGVAKWISCSLSVENNPTFTELIGNDSTGTLVTSISIGRNPWNITCADNAGNVRKIPGTITFNGAPSIVRVVPNSSTLFNSTVSWNVTVTDQTGSGQQCLISVGGYSRSFPCPIDTPTISPPITLKDGNYTFTLTVEDEFGSATEFIGFVLIDKEAPSVGKIRHKPWGRINTTIHLNGTFSGVPRGNLSITRPDQSILITEINPSWAHDLLLDQIGEYNVSVLLKDAHGSVSRSSSLHAYPEGVSSWRVENELAKPLAFSIFLRNATTNSNYIDAQSPHLFFPGISPHNGSIVIGDLTIFFENITFPRDQIFLISKQNSTRFETIHSVATVPTLRQSFLLFKFPDNLSRVRYCNSYRIIDGVCSGTWTDATDNFVNRDGSLTLRQSEGTAYGIERQSAKVINQSNTPGNPFKGIIHNPIERPCPSLSITVPKKSILIPNEVTSFPLQIANNGSCRIQKIDLLVEVNDIDWQVSAPAAFSLEPGEVKEPTIVIIPAALNQSAVILSISAVGDAKEIVATKSVVFDQVANHAISRTENTGMSSTQLFIVFMVLTIVIVAGLTYWHYRRRNTLAGDIWS